MNWFKHDSSARNDVRIKLLKAKFGAAGYGVYFQLLELIAENIKQENIDDWGSVEPIHTMDTLAIECGTDTESLRKIVKYCDEIGLLQKRANKLSAPKILTRLGDSMARFYRETVVGTEVVRSRYGVGTDKEKKRKEKNRKDESVREEKIAAIAAGDFSLGRKYRELMQGRGK